jgi:hypothetical protein
MVFHIIKNGFILFGDDRIYIVIVFSKVYSSLRFFSYISSYHFATVSYFLSNSMANNCSNYYSHIGTPY